MNTKQRLTFTLVREYGDDPVIYHVDLYRLDKEDGFSKPASSSSSPATTSCSSNGPIISIATSRNPASRFASPTSMNPPAAS